MTLGDPSPARRQSDPYPLADLLLVLGSLYRIPTLKPDDPLPDQPSEMRPLPNPPSQRKSLTKPTITNDDPLQDLRVDDP